VHKIEIKCSFYVAQKKINSLNVFFFLSLRIQQQQQQQTARMMRTIIKWEEKNGRRHCKDFQEMY
jgi:hypothetical protein